MTDNFDEFEPNDTALAEEVPAQRSGVGANLAEAWRARPLFKLLVLMTAVGAVVAASMSLFSGHETVGNSRVVTPPNLNVAPGGPMSPYMKQQTDLANDQRSKTALEKGGSALPTPIGQSIDVGDLTENKAKDDALKELRTEVEILQKQQVQQQQQVQQKLQQVQQPVAQQREQFDDSLAQAMQRQMGQLMESWSPHGIKHVAVARLDRLEDGTSTTSTGGGTATSTSANAAALQAPPAATTERKMVVQAGTVSYAQLLVEANSDVPGPILAQIVSGPLSGARAVGKFQVANGYNDYLVLQFTLADRKGKEYKLNAIALDPNTTLGGMATEVDQRYFTRVVLPAAAGFLQGLGSALGQTSSTTTTSGSFAVVQQSQAGTEQGIFQGLGQAAQTASQFFQNQANVTKPLVRVAAGTPMGLFFVEAVYEETANQSTLVNNYPGYNPALGTAGNAALAAGSPYGIGSFGAPPAAAQGGYGIGQPSTGTAGYGVPYPNYGSPANAGTGSSVSYMPGTGVGTTPYGR